MGETRKAKDSRTELFHHSIRRGCHQEEKQETLEQKGRGEKAREREFASIKGKKESGDQGNSIITNDFHSPLLSTGKIKRHRCIKKTDITGGLTKKKSRREKVSSTHDSELLDLKA